MQARFYEARLTDDRLDNRANTHCKAVRLSANAQASWGSADSCVARECRHCNHGASVGALLRAREGCSPPRLSLVSQHD